METILSINNLSKSYGSIHALKGVSFNVPSGSVFGILGPNGSGKTTLLGTILNVLNANSGTYTWSINDDHNAARRQIGSLLETPNFYHYLNAVDNLQIAAEIKKRGSDDKDHVLKTVGLWDRRTSKFKTYSLGMKQRLAIGAALLGDPDILVFDEPTNGLDPAGIAEIRQLIIDLNKKGKTIIMASHLLDEVEKVCTHVAILKKGDLLVSGKVDEVLIDEDQVIIASSNLEALKTFVATINGVHEVKQVDSYLYLSTGSDISTASINELCMKEGITLSHLSIKKKSLETKFIELTNN